MCTLIIGRDLVARGSVLVAANRDEDPARPTDPPGVLSESPRVVGGRDRRAGGTWLAVREARAVVAILNRRDRSGEPAPAARGRSSRGMLALEVAGAGEGDPHRRHGAGGRARLPALVLERIDHWRSGDGSAALRRASAALGRAFAALEEAPYAPFTLLFAAPEACWMITLDLEGEPRFAEVSEGWHALTHADLDDPNEPRTARLVRELEGFSPRTVAEAEQRLDHLLRSHGDPPSVPPVCLHSGPMVTVSASSVWLAADEARYRHAEGRPCEHAFRDVSRLLGAPAPERR